MNTDKKKLYISCPMAGRSEEAIRHDMDRMHKKEDNRSDFQRTI